MRHINVTVGGTVIMWSADEPLPGDAPGVPVGMVHLLNTANFTTLPIKVRSNLRVNFVLHYSELLISLSYLTLSYILC